MPSRRRAVVYHAERDTDGDGHICETRDPEHGIEIEPYGDALVERRSTAHCDRCTATDAAQLMWMHVETRPMPLPSSGESYEK